MKSSLKEEVESLQIRKKLLLKDLEKAKCFLENTKVQLENVLTEFNNKKEAIKKISDVFEMISNIDHYSGKLNSIKKEISGLEPRKKELVELTNECIDTEKYLELLKVKTCRLESVKEEMAEMEKRSTFLKTEKANMLAQLNTQRLELSKTSEELAGERARVRKLKECEYKTRKLTKDIIDLESEKGKVKSSIKSLEREELQCLGKVKDLKNEFVKKSEFLDNLKEKIRLEESAWAAKKSELTSLKEEIYTAIMTKKMDLKNKNIASKLKNLLKEVEKDGALI